MKAKSIDCTGYSVEADIYGGPSNNRVVLSLIGYQSSKATYGDLCQSIVKGTGSTVVVFDYSGHGDSFVDLMDTRPAQHLNEVVCVFDWIKDAYPESRITVMGASYGGFLAGHLARWREFDSMILRAPAIYAPDHFYHRQQDIDRNWTNRVFRRDESLLADHEMLQRLKNFSGKSLVIVHECDEVVPAQTTDAYIAVLNADVFVAKDQPHSIRDATKDDIDAYQNAISNWINQLD